MKLLTCNTAIIYEIAAITWLQLYIIYFDNAAGCTILAGRTCLIIICTHLDLNKIFVAARSVDVIVSISHFSAPAFEPAKRCIDSYVHLLTRQSDDQASKLPCSL